MWEWWKQLHPGARTAVFLALCMRAALEREWPPQCLLFCGLFVLLIACGAAGSHYRLLFWMHLMGLPGTMLLFIAIGYEQTRNCLDALSWGSIEALRYSLRVENVLLSNLVFISLTSTRELLSLLRHRWVPAPVGTLLSTAVRFVPLSLTEARRIYDVQRCRGLRLRPYAPRTWLPVVIPLFVSQMCRAHDTSIMLVVRRMDAPTTLRRSRSMGTADWLILGLALAFCLQPLL